MVSFFDDSIKKGEKMKIFIDDQGAGMLMVYFLEDVLKNFFSSINVKASFFLVENETIDRLDKIIANSFLEFDLLIHDMYIHPYFDKPNMKNTVGANEIMINSVPTILTTGYHKDEYVLNVFAQHPNWHYLQKPYTEQQLLELVKKILNLR